MARTDPAGKLDPDGTTRAARFLLGQVLPVAALAALYLPRVLNAVYENTDAGLGDQSSYLRLALKFAAGDGFANGNYHPLYALILQPWVSHDWAFFTQAKLVSAALGLFALLTVFWLGRRILGAFPALVAAAFMAWNTTFITRAARTEPEALLTGLMFAAWASWTIGLALLWAPRQPTETRAFWGSWLAPPESGPDDRCSRAYRWLLAAGLLGGLSYLAKGTGQFLLLGFVLSGLACALTGVRRGQGRSAWLPLGLLVGGHLLAASPLLVTNWREFGSPFYAFPSAHAMWYDSWDDRYGSDDGKHITMATYLASHTPAQMAQRLTEGMAELTGEWADVVVFLGRRPLLNLLVLAITILVLWRFPARLPELDRSLLRTIALTAGWLLLLAELFFGWYRDVVSSSRFLLPIAPVALFVYGWWLMLLTTVERSVRIQATLKWPNLAFVGLLASYVLFGASTQAGLTAFKLTDLPSPAVIAASDAEHNAATVAILDALRANVPPGGKYLWGPGDLATWPLYGLMSSEPIPSSATDWPALDAEIEDEHATHILLAPDMVSDRLELLGRYFQADTEEAVTFSALPPGWRLVAGYPEAASGCRYCLFALPTSSSPR